MPSSSLSEPSMLLPPSPSSPLPPDMPEPAGLGGWGEATGLTC